MGGGLSKKQAAAAARPGRAPPPPPANPHPVVPDGGWEVERVRDDGWEPVPYALLCPEPGVTPPRAARPPGLVPFDTPNGGAGVGSLRQRHLEEASASAEQLSELPPTALCVEVLEVSGLNDSASPVSARALCARPARGRLALTA